jgi:pyruvate dehydrogenase E2 component (dihydrolipoamide acetyltransferase)
MAAEFKLPELGENVDKGTVVRVLVKPGDKVAKDQGVVEVETDKASIEVPSNVAGTVSDVLVKVGEKVKPGQVIFTLTGAEAPKTAAAPKIEPKRTEVPAPKAPEPKPVAARVEPASSGPVAASPAVRRFAREIGVDISQVPAGADGHVTVDDVKAFAAHSRSTAPQPASAGLPDFSKWGQVERTPMSGVRRATAEHMAAAWGQVPAVTQHDRADITEFEALRKKNSASGSKITVTALALKLVAAALKHFPQFNASVDMGKGEVVYKKYVNVGVAVATDRGLLVPVIRDVDKKSVLALSQELAGLAEKARAKKLALEDMQGGCFTITNLGGIGGTAFSPIVNWPEVAILGMARSSMQPVYLNGAFVPRLMLPLSLSYDHRLIDGADAARFLRWVCEAVEQPMSLAFEGLI